MTSINDRFKVNAIQLERLQTENESIRYLEQFYGMLDLPVPYDFIFINDSVVRLKMPYEFQQSLNDVSWNV